MFSQRHRSIPGSSAWRSCGLICSRWIILLAVLVCAVPTPSNGAMPDSVEAALILQAIISDNDLNLMTEFYGFEAYNTIDYDASVTSTGWTASMSGTYLGLPLSLTYTGDITGYPSGAITWSATGTYGPDSWSSSGGASFVETSPTEFEIDLDSNANIATHTGVHDIIVTVEVGVGDSTYQDVSTTGDVTINAKVEKILNTLIVPKPAKVCKYIYNDIHYDKNGNGKPDAGERGKIISKYHIVKVTPTADIEGYLETVPEIPTLSKWGMVVMILLVLAVGTIVFRRRRATAI